MGAIALASAFRGGLGEPDLWLVAYGGPESCKYLQLALAGRETTGEGLPLQRSTRIVKDPEDFRVEIQSDGPERTDRTMVPPTTKLSTAKFYQLCGDLTKIGQEWTGLGLLNLDEDLVVDISKQEWAKKVPVVLVDTMAHSIPAKTQELFSRLVQICDNLGFPCVSVSTGDLGLLADSDHRCDGSSIRLEEWGDVKNVAIQLVKRLHSRLLLHDAHYAAFFEPDMEPVIVPTFDIKPRGTNGSGDFFNAGFLAAFTAQHIAASKQLDSQLSTEDCLLFANAVAAACLS